MSQPLLYALLVAALVLPVIGAAVLRIFFGRFSEWQIALVTTLVFGTAIASVLVLARSNADSLRIGGLTLLLPVSAPSLDDFPGLSNIIPTAMPPALPDESATPVSTPVLTVTATVSSTSTSAATSTVIVTPTAAITSTSTPLPSPTAILTPTVVLTPTATLGPPSPTPVPPAATAVPPSPTAAPAPPPTPRTYTVQAGDTLRSIATKLKVSVADLLRVNNLTPAQADALRPGQVLTVP